MPCVVSAAAQSAGEERHHAPGNRQTFADSSLRDVEPFVHVLTHKDLHLHPVLVELAFGALRTDGAWFAGGDLYQLGLPAPIRRLL